MDDKDKEFLKEVSLSGLRFSDNVCKLVNRSLTKGTLDPNLLNNVRIYFFGMFNRLQKLATDKDREKCDLCTDPERLLFESS